MYGWETRMLLKHYLDQGVSKSELARRFGINRATIHHWVKTGQPDRDLLAGPRAYSPRPPVACTLDPCKGIIDARLAAFPKLSAQRLFDEVRAAGYSGSCESVKLYVRPARPREPVDPVVRFETPAGRQGRVDFGAFTLPWGRRHALVVVPGYSRLLWLSFYPQQTMAVLMEALESAFEAFGGVPEALLFDQRRAVVLSDDRAAGGGLLLNAECLRFARHRGFDPRAGRAKTKGKVERPKTAMRSSRLPAVNTLDPFDFAFQPGIKREQIESLRERGFLDRRENVILLGPPGVGKTHLAISLAIAAAEAARRVCYGTLAGLIEARTEAKAAGNLSRRLRVLTHPALLAVDEIGCLPVNQDGAVLFFPLINARHQRASTVLTSDKGFEDRGGVLGDKVKGRRAHRPARPSLPHRQHPGELLQEAGSPEPAAGRLGPTPKEGRIMIAGHDKKSIGASRPLWITGLSPPDPSPGAAPGQLHKAPTRPTPRHPAWGNELTPEMSGFRLPEMSGFRLPLTVPC